MDLVLESLFLFLNEFRNRERDFCEYTKNCGLNFPVVWESLLQFNLLIIIMKKMEKNK